MSFATEVLSQNFTVSSSVADDVWHQKKDAKGYESWYFDALSDNGKEALVIVFFDNFIFSPRYNSNSLKKIPENKTFPAVAFTYYRNGKPLYRAINEFESEDFSTEILAPSCKIKDNIFQIEATPYGIRYILNLSLNLPNDCLLKGSFEWLLLEHDYLTGEKSKLDSSHYWNLVAPRCDVTGKFEIFTKKGKLFDKRQFRGSGYHDHNLDNRWIPETIEQKIWGRAHFADATAIFYRHQETKNSFVSNKLFIIRQGKLIELAAKFEETQFVRDIFGIKYPTKLIIFGEDKTQLEINQTEAIDSSFFYLRFFSEMNLKLDDKKLRKTIGVSEQLCPKILKKRWFDWLIDMRIGKNGKCSFLK